MINLIFIPVSYFLVGLVLFMNKSTEIKMLETMLSFQPVKSRKILSLEIENAKKEKGKSFLWPMFLINMAAEYVKKISKKE